MSDLNDLFTDAADEGEIGNESLTILTGPQLGNQIQKAMGVDVTSIDVNDDVIIVSIMTDDSSSIEFGGATQPVIDGTNLVIDALAGTKQAEGIIMQNQYVNGTQLYPFVGVKDAIKLDNNNFQPAGGTPLYDQTVVTLGAVLAKTAEFDGQGVPARSVTLIVSDGDDTNSRRNDASDCKTLIEDMIRSENHIVAALGVGNYDFRRMFNQMGIPDNWILEVGNTESEIRKAFQMFSQSAIRVSQDASAMSADAGFWD